MTNQYYAVIKVAHDPHPSTMILFKDKEEAVKHCNLMTSYYPHSYYQVVPVNTEICYPKVTSSVTDKHDDSHHPPYPTHKLDKSIIESVLNGAMGLKESDWQLKPLSKGDY